MEKCISFMCFHLFAHICIFVIPAKNKFGFKTIHISLKIAGSAYLIAKINVSKYHGNTNTKVPL